ncbi:TetR/AcrR family transcriptional regulator [Paenibacillus physcomitrellae]|uniref:TetR family transcriptional regulator n=1 Tax=Paenibacillus physcomitrellae TaxID=1619311 RepID=A0ABQ1FND9_9BACL|nr:TetR/AcrR family transcriptional regulator [Paenibacillus physcomitrellae]GGA23795.1 TetR family transcriptional regulator [Paenibacillus physcomitrellae]
MAKSNSTSVNRQKDIVSAAIEVFAEMGYYRATTAKVAERANISQPYVFRFFSTKEDLLIEALKVSFERINEAFTRVIHSAPKPSLERELIDAYQSIMDEHRSEILLQMQAQTIMEHSVAELMRESYAQIHDNVYRAFKAAGLEAPMEKTMLFLARGMLCNTAMAIQLPLLMKINE